MYSCGHIKKGISTFPNKVISEKKKKYTLYSTAKTSEQREGIVTTRQRGRGVFDAVKKRGL